MPCREHRLHGHPRITPKKLSVSSFCSTYHTDYPPAASGPSAVSMSAWLTPECVSARLFVRRSCRARVHTFSFFILFFFPDRQQTAFSSQSPGPRCRVPALARWWKCITSSGWYLHSMPLNILFPHRYSNMTASALFHWLGGTAAAARQAGARSHLDGSQSAGGVVGLYCNLVPVRLPDMACASR